MAKMQYKIVEFSAGNEKFYDQARDYYNEYCAKKTGSTSIAFDATTPFAEKESLVNEGLLAEILRKSGYAGRELTKAEFATNPMVSWATFAVVSAIVDMILPESLIDSIGIYSEMHIVGYGDSVAINIKPRDLFVVSKVGHGKNQGELKKQFDGQVTIIPENHIVSVYVDLYRVLAGLESLADFMAKCVKSIESAITVDTYNVFQTALVALPTTTDAALKIAGYTADGLVGLAQKVEAYNGGRQAVIVGTKLALSKVLPANVNFRYALDSDYVRIGYLRDFMGYSIIELPQVAKWESPFTLVLDDNHLYVISPSANKLVHVALGGDTLAYAAQPNDNANLIQEGTLRKQWGVAIATNSIAGIVTIA